MEPTDFMSEIEKLTGYQIYGNPNVASSGAAEAYVSIMKEIAKMQPKPSIKNRKVYSEAGRLLETLYPLEYNVSAKALNSSKDEYNLLLELITMDDKRVVRPFPFLNKLLDVGCLLEFSDFNEIVPEIRVLKITEEKFAAANRKMLEFDVADELGINTYKSVLFVRSTQEYKNKAVPFIYTKTLKSEEPGSNGSVIECVDIFRSPKIFNNNQEVWEIHLKSKTIW